MFVRDVLQGIWYSQKAKSNQRFLIVAHTHTHNTHTHTHTTQYTHLILVTQIVDGLEQLALRRRLSDAPCLQVLRRVNTQQTRTIHLRCMQRRSKFLWA